MEFTFVGRAGQTQYGPVGTGDTQVFLNGTRLRKANGGVPGDYTVVGEFIEITTIAEGDILDVIVTLSDQELRGALEDILTAVTGSWTWDKRSGLLTMLDRNGTERFKFSVSDGADSAHRERRQDLEV